MAASKEVFFIVVLLIWFPGRCTKTGEQVNYLSIYFQQQFQMHLWE